MAGIRQTPNSNVQTTTITYPSQATGSTPQLQIINSPGGGKGQVQFHSGNGSFSGDSNFIWNKQNRTMSILGNIRISENIIGKYYTNLTNFKITGGNSGQVLSTDGSGNLSWVDQISPAIYGNSNVANYLPTYTGNVSANYFIGNGSQLTGLPTQYSNSNVANYLPTYTGNLNGSNLIISNTGYIYNISSTGSASLTTANVSANLTANAIYTDNYFYANGSPYSGGGSELVNGNNSFVLDGDGNVVFEGDIAGQAVDRGLVWDYGANANGVNSTIQQDSGGLTVRAWTEDSGNFSAPVNIVTNQDANAKTWIFDGSGNLTLPGGGINQTSNEDLFITTFDDNGIVGSSLELSPGDTTRLEQWSSQDSDTFTTSDWTTGVYINPGEGGAVQFTGAANIIAFIDSLAGVGHVYFSVNGGTQLLSDGISSGGGNITFYTLTPPATDPTVVTSFEYFYSYNSGFEIVSGEGTHVNIYANDADITLETTGQYDISLDSSGDVILTANSTVNWTFSTTGNLTLPDNTFAVNYANGTQVSIGGNTGNVTFSGEAVIGTGTSNTQSGLYLAPDSASLANSLYLRVRGNILDEPTHIHFDTGNNQYYNQIIGDDNKYVQLANTGNIVINTSDYASNTAQWTFDTAGNLTLPEGTTIGDTSEIVTVTLDQFTDGGYPGTQVFNKVSDTLYELSPGGPTMTLVGSDWKLAVGVSVYYESLDLITWTALGGGLPTPVGTTEILETMNLTVGSNVWAFGGDGSLTLPIGVSIDYNGNSEYPKIIADSGKLFSVQGQGNSGSAALAWTIDPNAASQYAAVAVNRGGGDNLAKVVLTAQANSGDSANAKTWTFNENGNLILPLGGIIYETNIPGGELTGNTIVLKPQGGTNADQQLLVYPTTIGSDFNHLHLTSGNLYNTELFLGSDDLYVKLANTGNIVLNTNDDTGNSAQWTFGFDSNLTLPGGSKIVDSPTGVQISGAGDIIGVNYFYTKVSNTLYQTIEAGVTYQLVNEFSTWSLAVLGEDNPRYTSTDLITWTAVVGAAPAPTGTIINGSANITVSGNTWTFGADGIITVPGPISGLGYSKLDFTTYGSNTVYLTTTNDDSTALFMGAATAELYANTNVSIRTNTVGTSQEWIFDDAGNLTLPGNTFAVNYANGTQVSISGGSSSSSNISNGNSNVSIATANGNVTINAVGNNVVTITGTGANITGTANITGNVTPGNITFSSNTGQIVFGTGAFISGNANSLTRDGSILLQPYTGAGSTFPGVIIGGAGRLLAPNGGVFQIFNASDVTFQVAIKSTLSTAATSTTTGALIIPGGAGLAGSITTGIGALLTGPTFTPLANTMAGFVSNVNSYTQLTIQNKSTGADATTDFIATADNGTDTVNYADFGIINSGYDANTPTNSLGNIVSAADTYLYAQGNVSNTNQSGGNLAIGTTIAGKSVKIFAGGVTNNSIIATISNTGVAVNGNVTATNFSGNISITGNVIGTTPNVTLVAGSYSTVFANTGVATFPGNISTTGNFVGNGAALTNVAVSTTGTWTVATGINTYSITVPINGNYQLWVRGNIPNGIITYQATVSVTNTNVPVLGTQRAWNYTGGGSPILLTTMPTQIVGAEGTISTTVVSTTTANRFDFVINNSSGSSQTIYWGYVTL